jgi:hypothetical protein
MQRRLRHGRLQLGAIAAELPGAHSASSAAATKSRICPALGGARLATPMQSREYLAEMAQLEREHFIASGCVDG